MGRHDRQQRAKADPRMSGADVRYGGRTIQVTVYVNTDEDERDVALRIQEAAKGPGQRMVLVAVGLVDEGRARSLWEAAVEAAADTVKREPRV
jgi:hypothetical protein